MELVQIIESVLSIYYQTLSQKNWTLLQSFLSEDFTHFTDNCFSTDKAGFIQHVSIVDWTIQTCSISNLSIIPSESSDIVVAVYSIAFSGITNNIETQLSTVETCVLRHNEGNWKLAHCHTSYSQ